MKKYSVLFLGLASALSCSALTVSSDAIYVNPSNSVEFSTTKITGVGTVDELGSNLTYTSLYFYDADFTVNNSKELVLTSTNISNGQLGVSSSGYSIVCQGNTKITITDGGAIRSRSIALNEKKASFELTIDETAGDRTSIDRVFLYNGSKYTLNLHKENAFGKVCAIGSATNSVNTLNISKNQTVNFDFRSGSSKNYLNLTDGAILSIASISYVSASKSWQCNFTVENGLRDGGILFLENEKFNWGIDSWDEENAVFTINSAENQTIKYQFVDSNGVALTGLSYTAVDGGWLLTGAVPEPAEWAMIFGGIALGFAIYRRRK